MTHKPPPPTELPPIVDQFSKCALDDVRAVMQAHDWSAFAPSVVRTIEACMVAAHLRGQHRGYRQATQDRLRGPR